MACFSESEKIPSLNDAYQCLGQEWQQLLHEPRWSWVKTAVAVAINLNLTLTSFFNEKPALKCYKTYVGLFQSKYKLHYCSQLARHFRVGSISGAKMSKTLLHWCRSCTSEEVPRTCTVVRHFGTSARMSWVRSVLGPKCPYTRSAGLILLGSLFIWCQLSIRNSCFSGCMTASLLQYLNELVCWENCFACVTDIALRRCLAWTKRILLYNFYACRNVYVYFSSFYYCVLLYDFNIK